jgi:anti-anti-sigma factor
MPMSFQMLRDGETTVVRPEGDVVASSMAELRPAMRELVRSGSRSVVVDLQQTTIVDSTGLGLLLSAYNSLRQVEGKFAVVNASEELLDLFHSLRIHQHFQVSGK